MKFGEDSILARDLQTIVTISSEKKHIPFHFKEHITGALKSTASVLFGDRDILKSPYVNKYKRAKLINVGIGGIQRTLLYIPLKVPKVSIYKALMLVIDFDHCANSIIGYHIDAQYKVDNLGWCNIANSVPVRELRKLIELLSTDAIQ